MPACFSHEHLVTIADTNVTGTVYFTKYLEWLGRARETLLSQQGSAEEVRNGLLVPITKDTAITYLRQYVLYDMARIEISFGEGSEMMVLLYARFFRVGDVALVAGAKQVIVFSDPSGKLIEVPHALRPLLGQYAESRPDELDRLLSKRLLKSRALGEREI